MGTGGVPKGVEPAIGTSRHRSGPSDRIFQVIAVLGGLCLIGFTVFVAVRARAKSTRTLGIASLEAPPPAVLHAGSSAPGFSLPRAQVAAEYLLVALPVTNFTHAHGRVVGSAFGAQTVTSRQRWVNGLTHQAS